MEQTVKEKPPSMPRAEILLWPSDAGACENYPAVENSRAFKDFFDREGFIVVRKAVAPDLCETAKQAFLTEVLPDKHNRFIRHEFGTYDRHVFTEAGFMKYPIMNIQDIPGEEYPSFKKNGLDILTQPTIQRAVMNVFGEPGRVIHTMYFDGNQVTWAHRDEHYLDHRRTGKTIGIWVAAENIQAGAGRFFVIPRSHRMTVPGEGADPNGPLYKAKMADFIRHGPLDCVSPILQQGDVLLWSSLTIHGSLPTLEQQFSRRSFTAHYIPQSHQFQWSLGKTVPTNAITVNGVAVRLHDDQSSFTWRFKNRIRADYPDLFRMARSVKARLRSDA